MLCLFSDSAPYALAGVLFGNALLSALAGGIAFLSAVAFACSTSLQHQAAQSAPRTVGGSLQLVRHLFRQPRWLVGQLLSLTGLFLHSAALSIGTIATVQPIVISEMSAAVSWDQSTGPSSATSTKARAAALSRTCCRSRTLMLVTC